MEILISEVRISNFRGLENIEVKLEKTTVLTGMNNAGKTSFLKALQIALGNRQFISQDDFFIKNNQAAQQITIDVLIIPVDGDFNKIDIFSDEWEILFTTDRIRSDGIDSFIPLRTTVTFDAIKNSYISQQFIMQDWPKYIDEDKYWYEEPNGNKTTFYFSELPYFYMNAQRDILEDTKSRNSYISKMVSKIEYSSEDITEIEGQIKILNEKTVSSSSILSNLKTILQEIDSAMGSNTNEIDITPFTKKIRDLNKGLTIYYSNKSDSFPMEYHGMGTRSWSSLLTLKAFISLLASNSESEEKVFFPIISVEEPEAHLHPNAQKKLYRQISSIKGQTIISTHSPYLASVADLKQIRNLYKNTSVSCGQMNLNALSPDDIRKVKRQVINTRGEMFFSRAIVFFEGETEEQALPIFAEKFFGCTPVEMGLDFIGVGGYKSYLPFLRFANDLNIPWFILSDAETDAKTSVGRHLENLGMSLSEENPVIFLDDGNDFEQQLIHDDFRDEIKKSILSFDEYQNEQHKKASEQRRIAQVNAYSDEELYTAMTKHNHKTKYGPVVAEHIVSSGKELPPKVIELFTKIKTDCYAEGD